MDAFGTEISFRLGPDGAAEAREVAVRLAGAARGCRRHVLFLGEAGGGYGCLAEWDREDDARAYLGSPAVREEMAALERRTGRAPHAHLYAMEEQGAPPAAG